MRAGPFRWVALVTSLTACGGPPPRAGLITEENAAEIVPPGETAAGRPGDFYLRNDQAVFIVQRAERELALGPYGGNVVDAALHGHADAFGKLIPALALGRTTRIDSLWVIDDGLGDAPATIEGVGGDAANVYINLEGVDPELLAYEPDGGGLLGYDPDAPMGLGVRVFYRLPADEPCLSITYTFENEGTSRVGVPFGFIVDTRANVETFLPGGGYAESFNGSFDPDDLMAALAFDRATPQLVAATAGMALSLVPKSLGEKRPPRALGVQLPKVGSALLLEAMTVAGAARSASFTLAPGESTDVELEMLLAPSASEALARGWERLDTPLADLSGCVTLATGEPAAGVRVGVMTLAGEPTTTFDTAADGCFAGRAPPGRYRAIAGSSWRPASDEVEVEIPGHVELTLTALGRIEVAVGIYDTLEARQSGGHPCRVTLVGQRQPPPHAALTSDPYDDPGGVVARQRLLRACSGVIEVAAGRYLAIVTRGPEFDRLEQVLEVAADGAAAPLVGELHRVVDTSGYAASDFHVHSVYSPDSRVPAEERVLSIAAEGLDFWAATDHDMVDDFSSAIDALGLGGALLTVPGVEATTFDIGHFNAYPLVVDRARVNGGAPDWAPREDGSRPLMQELFDAIHSAGGFVQVNHPRAGRSETGAYFTRAGVRYDEASGLPFADPTAQPIANGFLRYPDGVSFFSDDFDIIEVMNGAHTYLADDMVHDRQVEVAGHDWMNLLSAGRRIVIVGSSDTHTLGTPPGNPRTMVGGHSGGVAGLLQALAQGDAFVTTGPMVRVLLLDPAGGSAALGETLAASSSRVTLRVEVETPTWYTAERVEVVANAFFPNPAAGGEAPRAVPLAHLSPREVARPNGGRAFVASTDIPLDLGAAPFFGRDSWIVVRVGGVASNLFPVMRNGGGTVHLEGTTPAEFLTDRYGVNPFAVTNPVYVDVDGDGAWRAGGT